jgi:hypothetical protein
MVMNMPVTNMPHPLISDNSPFRSLWAACLLLTLLISNPAQAEEYLSQADFLQQAFGQQTPEVKTLWLNAEQKKIAADILGHPYNALRLRYWQAGDTRAWITEEIGKERPIRIGVISRQQHVQDVVIMAFQESRGWEVRNRFFTDQFSGASLTPEQTLDRSIDGITGATLSVRAVTNSVRWILYLDSHTSNGS